MVNKFYMRSPQICVNNTRREHQSACAQFGNRLQIEGAGR